MMPFEDVPDLNRAIVSLEDHVDRMLYLAGFTVEYRAKHRVSISEAARRLAGSGFAESASSAASQIISLAIVEFRSGGTVDGSLDSPQAPR